MDRKFAAITANAKAEKRSSYNYSTTKMPHSQSIEIGQETVDGQKNAAGRSVSMREPRRDSHPGTPMKAGNSSGKSTPLQHQHPYVNILHQQHPQYYYNASPQSPYQYQHQHLQYQNTYREPHDMSMLNNSQIMDSSVSNSSMNLSWNCQTPPQITHYTAAQIYMRPKSSLNNSNPNISVQHQQSSSPQPPYSRRPPPEVPKRTSSIISTGSGHRIRPNGLSKSGKHFTFNACLCITNVS